MLITEDKYFIFVTFLIDMIILEIESEMPVKKEILLDKMQDFQQIPKENLAFFTSA